MISVLLSTNRLNDKVFRYIKKTQDGYKKDNDIEVFTNEFNPLFDMHVMDTEHLLEMTLSSLASQTFKDFELIISHRYPDDAKDIIKLFDFHIKLVKEKPSIWHDLGEQYHTVANIKNTSFINSSGELIYHIDDLTFFNNKLLQEAWDLWKEDKYMTGRTVRCITYDEELYPKYNVKMIGPNKTSITKDGWRGELKPLTSELNHPHIPMSMFWTCSASVSAEELLEINGYDELYDGSLAGIDMDAGTRLEKVSRYDRVASNNYLYEIDDPTPKNMVRDDVMMRYIFRVNHIRANSWKPTRVQMNRYKRWYEHKIGELDSNWDEFMNVPLYDIKRI